MAHVPRRKSHPIATDADPPSATDDSLASLLRMWRERALLTQEQLASRTGLGVRTIRRLETNPGRARGESVRLVGAALGLTESELAQLTATARGRPTPPERRAGACPPRQLPADLAGFAGRTRQLAQLDALLTSGDLAAAVPAATIIGTAGVGKTSLAVHWAHRVADRFPDGQLYLDLHGFDPGGTPISPASALRVLLEAIGVPARRIPVDPAAQAALYRSQLAGKRVLVVLDNARDAAQVRPLLPGTPGCLTVVTSRDQLTSLIVREAAQVVPLDVMSPTEAGELLAARLGAGRAAAEPAAVEEIAECCARLPLALAIVAARAAIRPGRALADLAGELRAVGDRLDSFETGDDSTDIRAVFACSYQCLSGEAANLFRLLGLHPGPDISVPAAAGLAGLPAPRVRALLGELSRAHLITEPVPGRYRCHDLLRTYATELANRGDPDQARAASHRLLDHYLHTAYAAGRLLNPDRDPITLNPARPEANPAPPADQQQAIAWFTAEHRGLLATVNFAAANGWDNHTWQLAWSLGDFLDLRGYWRDLVTTQEAALAAAYRLDDPSVQARVHGLLARAYARLVRFEDARASFRQALDLYHRLGDRLGQAHTMYGLAHASGEECRYHEALDHARHARTLYQQVGSRHREAHVLNLLAWYHTQLGDQQQALAIGRQALALHQELGDRTGEAATWDSLGCAYHQLSHYQRAINCYRRALAILKGPAPRYVEAITLVHLGEAHSAAGDLNRARAAWRPALAILDELGHPDAGPLRARLASGIDARRAPNRRPRKVEGQAGR